MTPKRSLLVGLFFAVFSVAAFHHDASAGEYVWARSSWGSMPMGQYTSSFSNGYGGYYVRANVYGNNVEGRGQFTNPGGYIVPAQSGATSTNQPGHAPMRIFHRRFAR